MKRTRSERVIYAQHRSSVWFTPAKLRALARLILGMALITLDPCTHKMNPIGAARFFTRADNALKRDWVALLKKCGAGTPTLWMNPPYGKTIGAWLERFLDCVDRVPHLRALVLVPSRPGARWYRALCDRSQCYCELDGRVRFEVLKGKRLVPAKDCARWGVTLVYFGGNRARVARLLAPFGAVRMVRPLAASEVALDGAQTRELAQLSFAAVSSHEREVNLAPSVRTGNLFGPLQVIK